MDTVTERDQARIAARYPKASPIDYVLGIGAGIALLGAIGLVVANGIAQSNPPVAGVIRSFEVVSPSEVTAELVIQRDNPADAVECRVNAQAYTYEKVAEDIIAVPPGTDTLTSVDISLKTIKEATTINLDACRLAG